jgi:predicted metal-dependent enzyme (double-stranded beta helix superfamily)
VSKVSARRFDLDAFIEACRQAVQDRDAHAAVHGIVERAVRHGPGLATDIPDNLREVGGLAHYSPDLTILWLEWPPRMYDPPHDHGASAVVGVYAGEEASTVYRRSTPGPIEPVASGSLTDGQVAVLGPDIIHAVTNPRDSWTGALHVYLGDVLSPSRKEWDPATLVEHPWDAAASLTRYAEAVAVAEPASQPRARPQSARPRATPALRDTADGNG